MSPMWLFNSPTVKADISTYSHAFGYLYQFSSTPFLLFVDLVEGDKLGQRIAVIPWGVILNFGLID